MSNNVDTLLLHHHCFIDINVVFATEKIIVAGEFISGTHVDKTILGFRVIISEYD